MSDNDDYAHLWEGPPVRVMVSTPSGQGAFNRFFLMASRDPDVMRGVEKLAKKIQAGVTEMYWKSNTTVTEVPRLSSQVKTLEEQLAATLATLEREKAEHAATRAEKSLVPRHFIIDGEPVVFISVSEKRAIDAKLQDLELKNQNQYNVIKMVANLIGSKAESSYIEAKLKHIAGDHSDCEGEKQRLCAQIDSAKKKIGALVHDDAPLRWSLNHLIDILGTEAKRIAKINGELMGEKNKFENSANRKLRTVYERMCDILAGGKRSTYKNTTDFEEVFGEFEQMKLQRDQFARRVSENPSIYSTR